MAVCRHRILEVNRYRSARLVKMPNRSVMPQRAWRLFGYILLQWFPRRASHIADTDLAGQRLSNRDFQSADCVHSQTHTPATLLAAPRLPLCDQRSTISGQPSAVSFQLLQAECSRAAARSPVPLLPSAGLSPRPVSLLLSPYSCLPP